MAPAAWAWGRLVELTSPRIQGNVVQKAYTFRVLGDGHEND